MQPIRHTLSTRKPILAKYSKTGLNNDIHVDLSLRVEVGIGELFTL